jgi:hypothetical protein
MTADKPYSWSAKPESLEAKFKLMCRLPYDQRVKRRHILVYGFILDWYHSHYGNALASTRHIDAQLKARDPSETGLYIGQIHDALTELVAWGYLEQIKGSGRRASRYIPVWAVLEPSVQESQNAISVRETENTSVRETENATAISVRDSMNEDPLTRPGPQDPGTCSVLDFPQATPAAEGGVLAGFEALASAYAKPGDDLMKARRAFLDIAPDEAEQARMVKAAESWRASAKGPRMSLANWLRFKPCPWLNIEQDNRPIHRWPACVITKIKAGSDDANYTAKIWFRDRDGASRMQVLGSREFRHLQEACSADRPSCNDPSDDFARVRWSAF